MKQKREHPGEGPSRIDHADAFMTKLSAAYYYYSGKLNRMYEQAVQDGKPPWKIICYRRVVDPSTLFIPISVDQFVTPRTFESNLRYLSRHCHVLSLRDLLSRISTGADIPPKTVALVFDGGWIDLHSNALPLLHKYNIPATAFLATSYVGTNNLYWPDKVMASLISLYEQGAKMKDILPARELFSEEELIEESSLEEFTGKTSELILMLAEATPEIRAAALFGIGMQVDEIGGYISERSFLNWDEIEELSKLGFDFATQGASHCLYSELSAEEMASDLHASLEHFRENNIEPQQAFFYPEGENTKQARELLDKLGVPFALAYGDFQLPKTPKGTTSIGCQPVHEAVAFSRSIFACRLWGTGVIAQ